MRKSRFSDEQMVAILREADRIGILMADGMAEARAVPEATWQLQRARCWERFQSHARIIMTASGDAREGLLEEYRQATAQGFGQEIAAHMVETMSGWITRQARA
jgi:hypothetical protein